MRLHLLMFAALTSSACALHIDNFFYHHQHFLQGTVTWNPSAPGATTSAEMIEGCYRTVDEYGETVEKSWLEVNGGIAFLDLAWEADGLRFETWGTDTDGSYGPGSIDIFKLPILSASPFVDCIALGPLSGWQYCLTALADNPYGFRITAGDPAFAPKAAAAALIPVAVPDSGATAGLLALAMAGLVGLRRRRA